MFTDDYIMRQIEGLSRCLAKVLFDRDEDDYQVVDSEGRFSDSDFFGYQLRRRLREGQINEAENLLFETVEREPRRDYLLIALQFYAELQAMTDEQLEKGGFSRAEIAEGIADLCGIYGVTAEEAAEEAAEPLAPGEENGGE